MSNITELIKNIRNSIYGKDVRESIAGAIEQCYEDASKNGNANMEVTEARGTFSTLNNRLNNSDIVKADKNELKNEKEERKNSDNQLQTQINSLASGSPFVANSIEEMTDTSRVYVNTIDGHWYTYNGNNWVDGGVYQSTEINNNSIDYNKLNEIIIKENYNTSILNERKGLRDGSGNLNNHIEGFIKIDSNPNISLTFIDNIDLFTKFAPKKIRCTYDFNNNKGNCGIYFSKQITEKNHNKKLIFTAFVNRKGISENTNLHSIFITSSNGSIYVTNSITDNKYKDIKDNAFLEILKTINNYDLIKYVVDLSQFAIGDNVLVHIRPSPDINFTGHNGYFDIIAPTFNDLDEDNIGIEKIFDTIQEKFNYNYPELIKPKTKPYENKKILFLGDSITRVGWDGDNGWLKYFIEIIKPLIKVDDAVNGAKMCDQVKNQVYDGNPVIDNEQQNVIGNQVEMVKNRKNQNLSDYQNFDYIIIAAGTNDNPYTLDENYNNIDSQFTASDGNYVSLDNVDRTTFAGAMRYIYQTLQSLYPNATIIFNTPTQTAVTSTGWWTTTKAYKLNKIIFDICKRLSVKVIDSYRCGICGIYEKDGENGRDLKDGIHPNSNGAKKLGYYNAHSFINQFYTINN